MTCGPLGPHLLLSIGVLLLIVSVDATAAAASQAYITGRQCQTTADCLAQTHNQWCASGQLCANRRCYTMPDYPCRRTDFCLEHEQRCVPRQPCTSDAECDDGLFCNGDERCSAEGHCQRTPRCTADALCLELNRTCLSVHSRLPLHDTTVVGKNSPVGAKTEAPTEAPTDGDLVNDNRRLWIILFIAGCVVGAIALVFWIVVGAARPAAPSSVIVITQNADGSDADGGRARMLLSRDNYQQRIHYS
jgi:hypothetical protein